MKESLVEAKEELKRADHLIYVTLKYTRTVDVIKNIIERIIAAFNSGINSLIEYSVEKKIMDISDIPQNPTQRCEIIKKKLSKEEKIPEFLDFYIFLRRINRAKYFGLREYRKHVTMVVHLDDGEIIEINIEKIHEYYDKAKNFVLEHVKRIIEETPDD